MLKKGQLNQPKYICMDMVIYNEYLSKLITFIPLVGGNVAVIQIH